MPNQEIEEMLDGVIEFDEDLFSVDGIKTYLRLVLKQPLIAAGAFFVYKGWEYWQNNTSDLSFYGFIATAIIFILVMWDSNRKSVNIYQESKDLKVQYEKLKKEIADKNVEIQNANAERMIKIDKAEFVIDHLKRNINILHREILDEIDFIQEQLENPKMVANPEILSSILNASKNKITAKVERIDANADAIGIPFKNLRGKITTGELKAIPSPKIELRHKIINELNNLKQDMTADEKINANIDKDGTTKQE